MRTKSKTCLECPKPITYSKSGLCRTHVRLGKRHPGFKSSIPRNCKICQAPVGYGCKKGFCRPCYRKTLHGPSHPRYTGAMETLTFKIGLRLRQRMYQAIKQNYKSGSAVNDLGCSIDEFKKYLESLFQPGMTWENWGIWGWHIDHIKPLVSFDLADREQFLKAVHYTNLQPLWRRDNLAKRFEK